MMHDSRETPGRVTSIGLREDGSAIAACERHIAPRGRGGTFGKLCEAEPAMPGNRLNEGVVGPALAFRVGTTRNNIADEDSPADLTQDAGCPCRQAPGGSLTRISLDRCPFGRRYNRRCLRRPTSTIALRLPAGPPQSVHEDRDDLGIGMMNEESASRVFPEERPSLRHDPDALARLFHLSDTRLRNGEQSRTGCGASQKVQKSCACSVVQLSASPPAASRIASPGNAMAATPRK